MPSLKFSNLTSLSNIKISNKIIEVEKQLFDLQFLRFVQEDKYKPKNVRYNKHHLAQLKTILIFRLNLIEQKRMNKIKNLINNHNYLKKNILKES